VKIVEPACKNCKHGWPYNDVNARTIVTLYRECREGPPTVHPKEQRKVFTDYPEKNGKLRVVYVPSTWPIVNDGDYCDRFLGEPCQT
jgi:hypothetical protein